MVITGNGYTVDFAAHTIAFPTRPDARVLSMLKANGFRWQPYGKVWYSRAHIKADFVAALDRVITGERPPTWRALPPGERIYMPDPGELAEDRWNEAQRMGY